MTAQPRQAAAAVPARARRGRPGNDLETVLAAAAALFVERGYEATSMEDVARRLGITKSTIYHHVQGKQELLRLAAGRALDGLAEAAAEATALGGPAVGQHQHAAPQQALKLANRLPYVTVLLRVRGNTAVEREALDRRREFDQLVTGLVRQAQAEGGIRPDADPATTSRLLFGMVNSVIEWYRPREGGAERVADAITGIAFEGLTSRRACPDPSREA